MPSASLSTLNPSDLLGALKSDFDLRNHLGVATVDSRDVPAVYFSNERPSGLTAVSGLEMVVKSQTTESVTPLLDGREARQRQLTIFVASYSTDRDLRDFEDTFKVKYGVENVTLSALDSAAFVAAVGGLDVGGIVAASQIVFTCPAKRYVGKVRDLVDAPHSATEDEFVRVNGQWQRSVKAKGGYEFTGGFTDRTTGTAGVGQIGDNVLYTSEMVVAKRWLRFGFSAAQQDIVDQPYWSSPAPEEASGVGLFGGSYMPGGVEKLFDFDFNAASFNDAVEDGLASLQYTAASGSFDFTDCKPGDLALIRFDFNVTPQIANTTMEVALIWQTRAADGTPTFTFPLTGNPIFLGAGSVAQTFLSRPLLSAYFASDEDVNARALLAVRADNPIQIQPLTTLVTIQR